MINLESQAKVVIVPAVWKKRIMQLPKKTDQREWPPQHTEKRGSDCSVKWSQSISSPSRDHGVANEPGDRLSTHRDKRVWTNHQLNDRLNRQTGSNESMERQEIKIKKIDKKKTTLHERVKKKMRKRTKAWRTTKSTWELRDGLAFGKSRCTYLLRKDNSQNHGNKQTNEEEKKQKKIKLNDKELFHHSPVNLVPGRLWCTALQLYFLISEDCIL